MSGAETARRRVVQRRIGGAEMSLPLFYGFIRAWCSSIIRNLLSLYFVIHEYQSKFEFLGIMGLPQPSCTSQ